MLSASVTKMQPIKWEKKKNLTFLPVKKQKKLAWNIYGPNKAKNMEDISDDTMFFLDIQFSFVYSGGYRVFSCSICLGRAVSL